MTESNEHPESTTEISADEVPISSRQRLLPLLVLCVLTMGVGFYFALQPRHEEPSTQRAQIEAQLTALEAQARIDVDSLGEVKPVNTPVLLGYSDAKLAGRHYLLVQSNRVTEPVNEPGSKVVMSFLASPEKRGEDSAAHRFSLDEVSLRIASPEAQEPLGVAITEQLEKSLETLSFTLSRQPMGATRGVTWQGRVNTQLRPVAALISSGLHVLAPVMPRTPVVSDEPWHYEVRLPGVEHDSMTMFGKLAFTSVLVGTVVTEEGAVLHVLSQKVRLDGSGEVKQGRALDYKLVGEGEGVVFFDQTSGRIQRHTVTLDTRLVLDDGTEDKPVRVQTAYLFALSAASPEVGE